MIHALQRRFCRIAMLAVSLLLFLALGAVNGGYLLVSMYEADRTLNVLLASGAYPDFSQDAAISVPGGTPSTLSSFLRADELLGVKWFGARLDNRGNVAEMSLVHVHGVGTEEAERLTEKVLARGNDAGWTGRYRYRVGQGKQHFVIFLDLADRIRASALLFVLSLGVGLGCWSVTLVLVLVLSKRAIRPVAQSMEKQKRFVTDAGHEIRTPLAVIQANVQAMELHQGETRWSRNIRTQTGRLADLTEGLLVQAKMDEISSDLPMVPFSLSELLEEMLDDCEEVAAQKGISLHREIGEGLILRGNRESVTRLISILMDNALRYTPSGGQIRISLEAKGREVALQAENTCRYPEELDLDRLFDRFYRGDPARSSRSGGFGIGLSVARTIVEAHGGTISAGAERGNTLCLRVLLPASAVGGKRRL